MKQYCDGGEAILGAFRSLSRSPPLTEIRQVNQQSGPAYIDCWHETLAVDMAMGYTQMTGRMQAVLLHAGAGLLQGSAGMHSAVPNSWQSHRPVATPSGSPISRPTPARVLACHAVISLTCRRSRPSAFKMAKSCRLRRL